MTTPGPVAVRFTHGLGDCVHFAHALQLWRRRGYEMTIAGEENKRFVWEVSGAKFDPQADAVTHTFGYPADFESLARRAVGTSDTARETPVIPFGARPRHRSCPRRRGDIIASL